MPMQPQEIGHLKKSSGGSKKRKSEAISEEEPAAEAGGDSMDMSAVHKLTADKLKKEQKILRDLLKVLEKKI